MPGQSFTQKKGALEKFCSNCHGIVKSILLLNLKSNIEHFILQFFDETGQWKVEKKTNHFF